MSSETLARLLRQTGEGIDVCHPPHAGIEARSRQLTRQRRSRVGAVGAALGVAMVGTIAAVTGGSDPELTPSAASPVLTLPPQSDWPLAEVSGVLSLQQGCLLVGGRAVVWPAGTTWDQSTRSVRYDQESYPVGVVVSGGGGYYSVGQWAGDAGAPEVWNAVDECAIATGVDEIVTLRPTGAGDPTAASEQLRCADATDPGTLPLPSSGTLAEGATQARLCPTNGAGWQPPPDTLVTGLSELVDLANTQPRHDGEDFSLTCMGDHPINDYAIMVAYPDGETVAIWGDVCDDVLRTGAEAKTNAILVLRTYLGALSDQRDSEPPPNSPSTPTCPDRDGQLPESILPTGNDLELVEATVCTFRWAEVSPSAFSFVLEHSSPMSAEQVRQINDGFGEHAVALEPDYDVGDRLQTITGVTAWGDHVVLRLYGDHLVREPTPAHPGTLSLGWLIDPDLGAALFGS